jgi:hypothetical protein
MMLSRRTRALLVADLLVLALAAAALVSWRPMAVAAPRELTDAPLAAPGEWFEGQRFGNETPSPAGYRRAIAQTNAARARTRAVAPELLDADWTNMGPNNIGGRVVELALDPTQVTANLNGTKVQQVVFAAYATGGVWRSGNGGETFAYSWDKTLTQSMGALAIGSDGVLYAGTGEANPGGGSITYGGTGMYRSKDKGKTWQYVGLRDSGAFGRIVVDPKNPQRVWAAAAGDLYTPGGDRGLYLSNDGGDTWTRVLAGENATTGAIDIAVDPNNPNNVMVAMWDHHRLPTHRMYAGEGSGVWRSTDAGATFTEVALPGNVAPAKVGRIGVAFAPSNPQRAYVVVASKDDGSGVGLWRSDNGGATFARTGASVGSLSQSTYGWWFGKIWVDPANANRLFVAGLELVESTDAGESFLAHTVTTAAVLTGAFQAGPVTHADQHSMAWDPTIPGRVYLGNDGGVYRSDRNAEIGTFVVSKSQGGTQHYSVDVSEQVPDNVITGMQDNLCQRNSPTTAPGTAATWNRIGICGDGLQTLINPADPTWTYACAQYGACGVQRAGVPHPQRPGQLVGAKPPGSRYGWMTPLEFDPTNPATMYFASNVVSKSTDNGITFTAISPDLTTKPQQLDPNTGYRIYGTITSLAVAKSDPKTIYIGTDDGLLWRTTTGGGMNPENWTLLTSDADVPGTWVTDVTVDPTNAKTVYATFSSFRNGSDAAHVLKSTDGGDTWTNISGDLPAAPVNTIEVIGSKLVAGTDTGAFISTDGGATWLLLGGNLPVVPILDFRYHAPTNTIYAATFGHGIQKLTIP